MNVETILAGKGRDVLTIAPDATVADAVRLLEARRVGAVVVSADGKAVAGILSERDIVHGLAAHGAALLDRRVDQLMTRNVVTCTGSDTDREVVSEGGEVDLGARVDLIDSDGDSLTDDVELAF